MVKLLIVDDSSFMRNALKNIFSVDKEIQVIGEAKNGKEGLELAEKLQPDIITLDIEMPVCDGLTMLKELMATNPRPVIMLSSLTTEGAEATLKALELGALDFMPKYKDSSFTISDLQKDLCDKVKILSKRARFMRRPLASTASKASSGLTTSSATSSLKTSSFASTRTSGLTGTQASSTRPSTLSSSTTSTLTNTSSTLKSRFSTPSLKTPENSTKANNVKSQLTIPTGKPRRHLVGIGISTGGPPALQKVLEVLPKDFPACIFIAQHMPASFTSAFAQRLNNLCKIEVKEAQTGDKVVSGVAYIAPGGKHIRIDAQSALPTITVTDDPVNALYKPSANVLFESLANFASHAVGVMMTGMGSDGLEGMKVFKRKGGKTIAQDEASCVVYGMPKAVVDAKIVDEVADVNKIAQLLINALYS